MAEGTFEVNNFFDLKGFALSKDDVNVVYIPIGRLPKGRAEEYMKSIYEYIKKSENLKVYKFWLIPFSN